MDSTQEVCFRMDCLREAVKIKTENGEVSGVVKLAGEFGDFVLGKEIKK